MMPKGATRISDQSADLTVVSYLYGPPSAEGICAKRLVDALRLQGTAVQVWSAASAGAREDGGDRLFPSCTWTYRKWHYLLGQLLVGAPVQNWDFVRRVGRETCASARVIYGRAMPLASLMAAANLAQQTSLPLGIHFSDPIPAPWHGFRHCLRWAILPVVRRLLRHAQFVTFTTEETRQYMSDLCECSLGPKSLVVHNIVPGWGRAREQGCARERSVVYIGSLAWRNPNPLVEGMARLNQRHPKDALSLSLVGTSREWLSVTFPDVVPVRYHQFTEDVAGSYSRSSVAAVIDYDFPLYLPTKAGEAIQAGRRVLFITSPRSPSRRYFERGLQSVQFARQDPEEIEAGLRRLVEVSEEVVEGEMNARHELLYSFRPQAVAGSLWAWLCDRFPVLRAGARWPQCQ